MLGALKEAQKYVYWIKVFCLGVAVSEKSNRGISGGRGKSGNSAACKGRLLAFDIIKIKYSKVSSMDIIETKPTLGKRKFKNTSVEEQERIFEARNCKNTNLATDLWIRNFRHYLQASSLPTLEELTNHELPEVLKNWFFNTCRTDEAEYKVSTMKCARAALNRYFKEKRGIDIIQHPDFFQLREYFRGILAERRSKGLGEVEQKQPLESTDMEKLQVFFKKKISAEPPDPRYVQRICMFNIMYYLGRRGRENLRRMTKETYKIATDSEGKMYAYEAAENSARMYEIKNSLLDPVGLFELYLRKLNPQNPFLWQRPKKLKTGKEDVWFDKQVVGKNLLNNIMKDLSKEAQLSNIYTNHCLKPTAVTKLDGSFKNRYITVVSHNVPEHSSQNDISHSFSSTEKETFDELPRKERKLENAAGTDRRNMLQKPTSQSKTETQNIAPITISENKESKLMFATTKFPISPRVSDPKSNPQTSSSTILHAVMNTHDIVKTFTDCATPYMYFSNCNITINYNRTKQ